MDTLERPSHLHDQEVLIEPEPPISVSHFFHVIRSYGSVILLSLAGVVLAFMIVGISLYLFAPAERVSYQTFRLDFEGAGRGEYPNKTKFNIADIINGPILTRVWQDDHLGDYIPFGAFSRAVYVLESNRQYEQLAAEYEAKLADPKLSPIDRERLQQEFDLKRQSIVKNEYAIYLDRRAAVHSIPEPVAQKVLLDILSDWADFAVNQQHVIAYQVSVLSPEILKPSTMEQNDVVAALEVLRSKANRVVNNIEEIEKLPGATLARTSNDHLSLEEVRIRLDEIIRFRLEPLLAAALHSPSLISDRESTIRFLQSQLFYDQRELDSRQRLADSARDALAVYEQPAATEASLSGTVATGSTEQPKPEAVTPQLSDTFLDRLMAITGQAQDTQYRQGLVDDYRRAIAATIPLKQAVSYDTEALNQIQKPAGGATAMNAATVRAQIEQSRADIGQMISEMNELFQVVSRNMTPSTQLFTLTGPPVTRTLRSVSPQRLALYGLLVVLVALPAIIVLCLLHNRVREEEAADEYLRQERKLASAETMP